MKKIINAIYINDEPVFNPIEVIIKDMKAELSLMEAKTLFHELQESIEACEWDMRQEERENARTKDL